MYDYNEFWGDSWLLTRNDSNSINFCNFGANNKVSSAKVRKGITFYEDMNYQGRSTMGIQKGLYTLSELQNYGFVNDWVSSVSIPVGWHVRLYEHNNFQGNSWMLNQIDSNSADFSNFGANDKISSIYIY